MTLERTIGMLTGRQITAVSSTTAVTLSPVLSIFFFVRPTFLAFITPTIQYERVGQVEQCGKPMTTKNNRLSNDRHNLLAQHVGTNRPRVQTLTTR